MKIVLAKSNRVLAGWSLAGSLMLAIGCSSDSFHLRDQGSPIADTHQPSTHSPAIVEASPAAAMPTQAAMNPNQDSAVSPVSYDEPVGTPSHQPAASGQATASQEIPVQPASTNHVTPNGAFKIEHTPYAAREATDEELALGYPTDGYGPLNCPPGMIEPQYGYPTPPPGLPMVAPPYRTGNYQFKDEYLRDGGDRNTKVRIGDDWSIRGMDIEDTVVHYDTLAGERKITPSNRVEIYAPRFGSVRKSYGLIQDNNYGHFSQVDSADLVASDTDRTGTIDTHQTIAPDAQKGRKSSSVFRDRTRGLTVENPEPVAAFSNVYAAYEDLHLVRFGVIEQSEKARLAEGIQAAEVWKHDQPVQAVVDNREVIVSRGVDRLQETLGIELKKSNPRLHIVKLAPKTQSAKPGDEIEFTIRFDNVGNEKVGNVTILDNLTPRLEYIEESAQCDLDFEFFTTENEGGSLLLRWEIKEPLEVQTGGVIRFKCRVR